MKLGGFISPPSPVPSEVVLLPSSVSVSMLGMLMMRRCDSVVAGVVSVMSIQDKLICVCLVMPHCTFSMQLFLSEIVMFRFDQKEIELHTQTFRPASFSYTTARLGVFSATY